jgi:hypothetical protein
MEGNGVKYPPLPQRKSLSPKKHLFSLQTTLPLDSAATAIIDFSLLDYKQPEDFLARYSAPGDDRILLEHMTYQLKVSRALLELSTASAKSGSSDVVGKIIDCAQAIVDAEKIVFVEIDLINGDLLVNGATSAQHQPMITRIRSGIECLSSSLSISHITLSPHML